MALVDLSTGKIHGCEEGSKTWYHEKGHIVFNDSTWGAKISYYGVFFQMITVFFLALSIIIDNLWLHLFTLLNALGMIFCYIFEEAWCWSWGLREWSNNRLISSILKSHPKNKSHNY